MTFRQVFAVTLKAALSVAIIGAICGVIYGIGLGLASARYDPAADLAARNARINQELDADAQRILKDSQEWGPVFQRCYPRYAGRPQSKWPAECKAMPASYRRLLLPMKQQEAFLHCFKPRSEWTDECRAMPADLQALVP